MEQQICLDRILSRNDSVLLTGAGGTGKTHTIRLLLDSLHKHHIPTGLTAMTGCAALLLGSGARTLHSWAGIGLGREDLYTRVRKNRDAMKRWKTTAVLIIDEVSMLGPDLFESLECLARKVRDRSRFFGGMRLVLVGDFFQLPPVGEDRFLFESPVFRENIRCHIHLRVCHRQKEDPSWIDLLHKIRVGSLDPDDVLMLRSLVRRPSREVSVLFPHNHRVDKTNEDKLDKLDSEIRVFHALPRSSDTTRRFPTELRLAVGAVVQLTWNMDLCQGLVNGSQGVVLRFSDQGYPVVDFHGRIRTIEPIEYTDPDQKTVSMRQIPLRLAWALTIHRVQGQSLDEADIDLGPSVFEYGQVYVALSRLRTRKGVYLQNLDPSRIVADPRVIAFYETMS